jgi:hypothetical protein
MTYCKAIDVVKHLGIDSLTDTPLIESLVVSATAFIDGYCHRAFAAAADTTRYIDARGRHIRGLSLFLDNVGELAQITQIVNGDGLELASTDYVTTPRTLPPFWSIRIKGRSGKQWTFTDDWEGAIEITGRWAYSITPPDAIREACVQYAAFLYRQKDQPLTDVTAIEAGVVMRPVGLPVHIKMMLAPFVRPM